jgi:hypothetical protein
MHGKGTGRHLRLNQPTFIARTSLSSQSQSTAIATYSASRLVQHSRGVDASRLCSTPQVLALRRRARQRAQTLADAGRLPGLTFTMLSVTLALSAAKHRRAAATEQTSESQSTHEH